MLIAEPDRSTRPAPARVRPHQDDDIARYPARTRLSAATIDDNMIAKLLLYAGGKSADASVATKRTCCQHAAKMVTEPRITNVTPKPADHFGDAKNGGG